MTYMDNERRINYLQKKYSETNVGMGEELFKPSIQRINKNYYSNQQRRRVDGILNKARNRNTVKEEVHQIVADYPVKSLCYNCKEDEIIAAIILYVSRARVKSYRIDRTALWKEYNLTWQKYALIVTNLLREVRARG